MRTSTNRIRTIATCAVVALALVAMPAAALAAEPDAISDPPSAFDESAATGEETIDLGAAEATAPEAVEAKPAPAAQAAAAAPAAPATGGGASPAAPSATTAPATSFDTTASPAGELPFTGPPSGLLVAMCLLATILIAGGIALASLRAPRRDAA